MDLKFCPRKIRIWYFNGQGNPSSTNILPTNDYITLKATKGFISATYNWEYSTDNRTWRSFPYGVTYTNNKSEVTFRSSDLLSLSEFKNLIGRGNVYIRINTVTSEFSPSVFTLIPRLSAPKIQNISYDLERCYNSQDIVVKITFNRALESGEIIYITKNNQIDQGIPSVILDASNTGKLPNVAAGTYRFGVTGSFNGQLSYNESTYHAQNDVIIRNRLKVNHNITRSKPTSCFDGSDGEITITAGGGTGSFVGEIYPNGQSTALQSVSFNQNSIFTRLKSGLYNIKIYDNNGCQAFDTNGNELTHLVKCYSTCLTRANCDRTYSFTERI